MVAEETRVAVQAEEAKATEKARVAQAIAADAQKDLDEALPALDAALDSLKSLKKNDVVEVHTSYFQLTSVQNTTMFWSCQLTRRCVCVCVFDIHRRCGLCRGLLKEWSWLSKLSVSWRVSNPRKLLERSSERRLMTTGMQERLFCRIQENFWTVSSSMTRWDEDFACG